MLSRVVWSASALIRADAVSVRPLRKDNASGVRDPDSEGCSLALGKTESRYWRTERESDLEPLERTAACNDRLPRVTLVADNG